jgi:uncharacterized protein DUF3634
MTWLVSIGLLGLALWPLIVAIRRSTDLFVLRVREGRVRFTRGRMPQGLLDDIADVMASPSIRRAELRAVRRNGRAELVTRGEVSPEQLQRLRNVLGRYPVAQILAGARPGRPRPV